MKSGLFTRHWSVSMWLCVLFCMFFTQRVHSESYLLSVGESVTISQTAYAGGYIDNVGLADYLDPHLDFEKTWDNSAKITVKSYFDYPVIVKLVFIERYKDPYTGRIRAATYYRNITINCKYQAPDPSQKVTKVILPERVRVPVDNSVLLEPVYEPTGSKPNIAKWTKEYGGFTPIGTEDGCCRINGKVIGIGKLSVQIDNSSSPDMNASTIVEIVDPNNLPPVNVFLPSSKEISVNGHCTLEPILVPEDAATAFTWSSSNNSIASVSYGKVTGKKAGTVTITVKTTNDLEATCSVTVVNSGGKDDEDGAGDNTTGSIDGHGYIDLGLSVKWATCNVGSLSPEGFGGYYAWGETTEKSTYSWKTYLYSGNSAMDVYFIGNDIKGTQYDAAYVNWGKNWRMPTEAEIGELIAKCTIEKKNQSGVDGYLVTGPNGSSIFLPKAGEKTDTYYSAFTRYWSSTANGEYAKCLLIDSQQRGTIQSQYRFKGLPIRAVTEGISNPPTPLPKLNLSASPSGGQISAGTTVTLTAKAEGSTVSGCDIYYTTNGSTPTKSSTKYTSSGITINSNCTLKAIAYKDGYETSEVLEENYTIKSSNIEPTGIDVSPSSKTIKVGETFYCSYTLTPSNATTTVTWYSDNSNVASVNSSGLVTGVSTGYTYINAKTANGKEDWCKVTVESNPNPKLSLSASPSGGEVAKGTTVTLTVKANGSNVYGCDIYYTTNGSTPTKSSTKYTSSGITINNSCTLKAIAYKDGYETSDVLTTSYTINPSNKIYLIASPSGGSVSKGTVVKLYPKDKIDDDPRNMNDVLADIYYTLDGTTPTRSSIKYTSSGIVINDDCTLKAIGFSVWNGWMDSDVLTEYYTIKQESSPSDIKQISAGGDHSMILKKDGSLWACGQNSKGQLGDGTNTNHSTPKQAMTDVAAVSAGYNHTMIIKTDGSLWACGNNKTGQLGDGTNTGQSTPKKVMNGVAAVSAGGSHTMILKTDGSLWACGDNYYGQLGDGSSTDHFTPKQVMTDVAAVSAGWSYTMILKTYGSLWACGRNNGQLGVEDFTQWAWSTPKQVMFGVSAVSAGSNHTMILKTDGSLWACGDNDYGQLGDGTNTRRGNPMKVMNSVAAVSAGSNHTMILKTDGSLWACGENDYGQLGDGTNTHRRIPMKVMNSVAAVSAGSEHTMILKIDGSLWACGKNEFGQLGDGTTTNRNTPVMIWDGTSDIQPANVDEGQQGCKGVYNLHGQKVDKPVKGLYIVNGRKVLMK